MPQKKENCTLVLPKMVHSYLPKIVHCYLPITTTKNNIDGSIIFTDNEGYLKSYRLHKFDRNEFNIPEMRKNEWVSFDPDFVEFQTSDDIEEIIIDIAPVNPQVK